MKKISKEIIVIIMVVLVAVSLVSFIMPFPKTKVFWLSYGFFMVAVVAQFAILIYTNSSHGIKDEVYSWPVIRTGLIYLFVSAGCAVIFTAISCFVRLPLWIPCIAYIIISAIAIISIVTAKGVKSYVEDQDRKTVQKTSFMSDLYGEVQVIISQCNNPKWKMQLEQLADDIRFSDPVSSDNLIEIESELEVAVRRLKKLVSVNDENVPNQLDNIERILMVRNRKCKMTK